jgi:hypothetical protein
MTDGDVAYVIEGPADLDDPRAFRAAIIAQAFEVMSGNPSVSGMTLMIPDASRKDGIETIYLPNPSAKSEVIP